MSLALELVGAKGELGAEDTVQRDELMFWKDNPGCFVGPDHIRDRVAAGSQARRLLRPRGKARGPWTRHPLAVEMERSNGIF